MSTDAYDHRSRPLSTTAIRSLVAAMALALLASCSGDRPSLGDESTATTTETQRATSTSTTAPAPPLADMSPGPSNVLGYIATPSAAPEVHQEPDAASPIVEVPATTPLGAPTTFAIVGDPVAQPSDWYKVLLPTRPNGSTGWVRASTVELTRTDLRMLVDLEARSIRLQRDGTDVFEAEVAIGTEADPTPTGTSFVTELIESIEPEGAYGPYAIGLSMHSDTQTEFAGGDGQVGIHGTNQPELIGDRVSHGCVRLRNDDIERLVALEVPLGTPVFVT